MFLFSFADVECDSIADFSFEERIRTDRIMWWLILVRLLGLLLLLGSLLTWCRLRLRLIRILLLLLRVSCFALNNNTLWKVSNLKRNSNWELLLTWLLLWIGCLRRWTALILTVDREQWWIQELWIVVGYWLLKEAKKKSKFTYKTLFLHLICEFTYIV